MGKFNHGWPARQAATKTAPREKLAQSFLRENREISEISEPKSALGEGAGFFAYFAVLYRRIVQFQQDFCRKGTQRTQRQGLMQYILVPRCFQWN
jgi:hypothetical protein